MTFSYIAVNKVYKSAEERLSRSKMAKQPSNFPAFTRDCVVVQVRLYYNDIYSKIIKQRSFPR